MHAQMPAKDYGVGVLPLLLLLATPPSTSTPPGEPLTVGTKAPDLDRPPELIPQRTGSMALMLGLGSTLASYGLVATYAPLGDSRYTPALTVGGIGVFAGPSMGQIYAGSWVRPLIGTGGRGVAALMMLIGAFSGRGFGVAMALAGGSAFVGLTIADIVDSPYAVRRARERNRSRIAVAIVPIRRAGRVSALLTISGRF